MSEDTWAGVRERVLRLAEHPGADEVFGARGHGFRLGSVMGEDQLQDWRRPWASVCPSSIGAFCSVSDVGERAPTTA
ncbi:hypothetical protein ACFVT6_02550 [Streptomyces sp. NPDC058049]|uniref:hypothetical protein n=1 Tax=Streptomyces sp. NPDC058049 TaxID=3346314 RepID=UPI0036ED89E7